MPCKDSLGASRALGAVPTEALSSDPRIFSERGEQRGMLLGVQAHAIAHISEIKNFRAEAQNNAAV